MSGGSLPRTGIKAVVIGGVGGVGVYAVPLPMVLAAVAAVLVVAGALLVRFSFRPGRAASRR